MVILGVPGKVVREVRPDEIEWAQAIAASCVQRARRFKADLKAQP